VDDIKHQMKDNFLKYASYVILDRAIPNALDGLKPVQRRILHTLRAMHDGKLHKVANVAGQTMAYHPHGDAAIIDALVNLSNKGFLLDQQGNFGNLLTGDPPAAARYIETRLSELAMETMFNPDLTEYVLSYDSRNKEPVCLPAKIPLLLMQGTDGIAVGMSTHILPHNFIELLEAEIALIEGKNIKILPDFPTGGIMDATQYDAGRGKVKLRVKIEERDVKTLAITQICYGTTTESLIRSIDEAAKKGKIKIDAINDYTADKVEIEIKLPRGHYAQDLIDSLYAYTECEVSLTSQVVVIKDGFPWETDVHEILKLHATILQEYLHRELEIEKGRLLEKIFDKTLEQIFIENRLYKKIETVKSKDEIHTTVEKSLVPYHKMLSRIPTFDDRERLLQIPIRRISQFDIEKNQEDIKALGDSVAQVEKNLKGIKKYTINYLEGLIEKYGKEFRRKTKVQAIEELDFKAIDTREVKIGFDPKGGFLGTKVTGDAELSCTNYDKLLLFFQDGTFKVINIPEKQYVHQGENKVILAGVADKKTVLNVIYKNPKTHLCFAKKFVVGKFILDKTYRYFEEGMTLELITAAADPVVEMQYIPKVKQKLSRATFNFDKVTVKGIASKGIKMTNRGVKKILGIHS
jgi:topoisomerase-4 subunit A